jgi:hypothetical protein
MLMLCIAVLTFGVFFPTGYIFVNENSKWVPSDLGWCRTAGLYTNSNVLQSSTKGGTFPNLVSDYYLTLKKKNYVPCGR